MGWLKAIDILKTLISDNSGRGSLLIALIILGGLFYIIHDNDMKQIWQHADSIEYTLKDIATKMDNQNSSCNKLVDVIDTQTEILQSYKKRK